MAPAAKKAATKKAAPTKPDPVAAEGFPEPDFDEGDEALDAAAEQFQPGKDPFEREGESGDEGSYRPAHVDAPVSHAQGGHAAIGHEQFAFPETWTEPSVFPDIPAREGMENRWIMVEQNGRLETDNSSRKLQYWHPLSIKNVPAQFRKPHGATHGTYGEVIYCRGHILCESPIHLQDQRRAAIRKKSERQTKGRGKSDLASATKAMGRVAREYGAPSVLEDRDVSTTRQPESESNSDVAPD